MLQLARCTRSPRTLLVALVGNPSYRSNHLLDRPAATQSMRGDSRALRWTNWLPYAQ